jgi:hypothetical protein
VARRQLRPGRRNFPQSQRSAQASPSRSCLHQNGYEASGGACSPSVQPGGLPATADSHQCTVPARHTCRGPHRDAAEHNASRGRATSRVPSGTAAVGSDLIIVSWRCCECWLVAQFAVPSCCSGRNPTFQCQRSAHKQPIGRPVGSADRPARTMAGLDAQPVRARTGLSVREAMRARACGGPARQAASTQALRLRARAGGRAPAARPASQGRIISVARGRGRCQVDACDRAAAEQEPGALLHAAPRCLRPCLPAPVAAACGVFVFGAATSYVTPHTRPKELCRTSASRPHRPSYWQQKHAHAPRAAATPLWTRVGAALQPVAKAGVAAAAAASLLLGQPGPSVADVLRCGSTWRWLCGG